MKDGRAPIYCRITVNGQRIEFSVKRSVPAKLWNNGRVKGNSEEARTLREYLRQVEAKLFEHYRNLLADNELVTVEALKNAYLGIEKKQYSLLELMNYHNHQLKDGLEWGDLVHPSPHVVASSRNPKFFPLDSTLTLFTILSTLMR